MSAVYRDDGAPACARRAGTGSNWSADSGSVRAAICDPDAITCLECGYKGQMLKRHLTTAHDMPPEQYRERWKLPGDYPMVVSNYANRRSELAKSMGLGERGRNGRGRAKG